MRTYFVRCGDTWGSEDAEIGFPPPGDTARHDAPGSLHLQSRQPEPLQQLRCSTSCRHKLEIQQIAQEATVGAVIGYV